MMQLQETSTTRSFLFIVMTVLLAVPYIATVVDGQQLQTTNQSTTNDNGNNGDGDVGGCNLCEDGSDVPYPELEALPSKTCFELQIEATKEADPLSCTTWQQTIGIYCGCNNNTPAGTTSPQQDNDVDGDVHDGVCRICGNNNLLSEPNKLYFSLDTKRQKSIDIKTCLELEWEANQQQQQQALSNNNTTSNSDNICSIYQELYSNECCLIECPLCQNPQAVPQDLGAVFIAGENVISCETALEMGSPLLSRTDCEFWQYRGESLCYCNTQPQFSDNYNDCRLCEDRSVLPQPRLEGLPGRSCSLLQVDAIRDDPSMCPIWQKTVGTYCGCNNPKTTHGMCHICGEYDLPNPVQLIDTRSIGNFEEYTSCGKLEFLANLETSDCELYQFMFKGCCKDLVFPFDDDGRPRRDVATATLTTHGWSSLAVVTFVVSMMLIALL